MIQSLRKTSITILTCFFVIPWSVFLGCGGSKSSSGTVEPTLSSIQSKIFNSSCALASCHNSSSAQGDLALNEGNTFDQLINIAADNVVAAAAGKKRVIPGDPDNSFLIQKLEGPGSGEGDRMPQSNSSLSQEEIDVIRQWIEQGALDN